MKRQDVLALIVSLGLSILGFSFFAKWAMADILSLKGAGFTAAFLVSMLALFAAWYAKKIGASKTAKWCVLTTTFIGGALGIFQPDLYGDPGMYGILSTLFIGLALLIIHAKLAEE